MNFPDTLQEVSRPLDLGRLSDTGRAAASQLAERGYEVHVGLTPELVDRIGAMASEPSIREYCPKDLAERFTDRSSAERWLAKKRGTFLLLKRTDKAVLSLAGYGWVGAEKSSKVPQGETTFAIRIGEIGQGQGLAALFAQVIIASSSYLYGARNIWLETWSSNGGAVHIYHKIGFVTVAECPGERLSSHGQTIADTRLYMTMPTSAENPA